MRTRHFINIYMTLSILSNTCVGSGLYQKLNMQYNCPLIGSLILNDDDWLRLCERPQYYFSLEPKFIKSEDKYRSWNYPIVMLEDVRIDFIHETNDSVLYEKYKRRAKRFFNTEPCLVWSYYEMFSYHDNYHLVIDKFLSFEAKTIFVGPEDFKSEKGQYIIEGDQNVERDSYGVTFTNFQLMIIERVIGFLNQSPL